jgi:hypothetical protein
MTELGHRSVISMDTSEWESNESRNTDGGTHQCLDPIRGHYDSMTESTIRSMPQSKISPKLRYNFKKPDY